MAKRRFPATRATWAAAGLCLASALFLSFQLWQDAAPAEPAMLPQTAAEQPPPAEPVEAALPFSLKPAEDYAEITERPLFSRGRRPPPPGEGNSNTAGAGDDAAASQIFLNGVLLVGNKRVALLRFDNDPKVMHVAEGQEAGGWLIEAVRPDRVILRRGDTASEVALSFKRAQPGAAARAAPPPGPAFSPHEAPTGEDEDAHD